MITQATLSGPLPAKLGNAVSDEIYAAVTAGMKMDEACCVVLTVVSDYARGTYGDGYIDQLKELLEMQRGQPLPPEGSGT